jgi:hypothetical protein
MEDGKGFTTGNTPEQIYEFLVNADGFAFEWNSKDYYIEPRAHFGYIVVDPDQFFNAGGYAENPIGHYPMSGKAKTPSELWALPFLGGATISDRFDELKFFDYSM